MLKSIKNIITGSGEKSGKAKIGFRILIGALIVIFAIGGIASISFSQKMRDNKKFGPWPFLIDKITADLNLTADQKTKIQALKDEIKAKMESKKKDKKDDMSDFESAFKQDKLDKQTLESLYQKQDSDKEEMRSFFEDEIIKFHDILTADQRVKAVDKMKELKEKMNKHKPDNQ
jgi:Spy/CpxP family protein refolding chaperone